MEIYRNSESGIIGFLIGEDYIDVKFKTYKTYTYTYRRAGSRHVEKMKILAVRGRGLNTYINNYVKDKYERKVR